MVSNKFDVSGKCCIITGGTRGLGRGMAEGLLENGAKVVMMARSKEKLDAVVQEFKAKGYEAFGVSGDVSDRKELSRMFDEAFELLGGRIDVLIPAAGIQRRYLPEQFPEEMWDEVINTNLHHVWFACQKALPLMLKQYQQDNSSRGKIILIGSMVSWFGGTTVPAYTAAKGADPVKGMVPAQKSDTQPHNRTHQARSGAESNKLFLFGQGEFHRRIPSRLSESDIQLTIANSTPARMIPAKMTRHTRRGLGRPFGFQGSLPNRQAL